MYPSEHHKNVDAGTFLSRTVSLADSVIDVVIDSKSECIFFLCCSTRKDTSPMSLQSKIV